MVFVFLLFFDDFLDIIKAWLHGDKSIFIQVQAKNHFTSCSSTSNMEFQCLFSRYIFFYILYIFFSSFPGQLWIVCDSVLLLAIAASAALRPQSIPCLAAVSTRILLPSKRRLDRSTHRRHFLHRILRHSTHRIPSGKQCKIKFSICLIYGKIRIRTIFFPWSTIFSSFKDNRGNCICEETVHITSKFLLYPARKLYSQIDELPSKLIEMCLQCYSARGDTRQVYQSKIFAWKYDFQVLHIASRMNLSSVLSMVDVSKYLSEDVSYSFNHYTNSFNLPSFSCSALWFVNVQPETQTCGFFLYSFRKHLQINSLLPFLWESLNKLIR